ncbi:hypothetical protein M2T82_01620 [Elizabethkingia ursingii]|uniref:hypothetical protein n=1 Tax=Elizabethkingia ursingii TaxID=1756150 RepID=UPI0020132BC9|nr:hypothetical protein [Elizabethkingia ursingii]MCL1666752.1 hypothetical protein [Elizabethkingia ursingii]
MKKLQRAKLKSISGGYFDDCMDHIVNPSELPGPGGYYNCPCKEQVFCRNMGACVYGMNGIPDFCEI